MIAGAAQTRIHPVAEQVVITDRSVVEGPVVGILLGIANQADVVRVRLSGRVGLALDFTARQFAVVFDGHGIEVAAKVLCASCHVNAGPGEDNRMSFVVSMLGAVKDHQIGHVSGGIVMDGDVVVTVNGVFGVAGNKRVAAGIHGHVHGPIVQPESVVTISPQFVAVRIVGDSGIVVVCTLGFTRDHDVARPVDIQSPGNIGVVVRSVVAGFPDENARRVVLDCGVILVGARAVRGAGNEDVAGPVDRQVKSHVVFAGRSVESGDPDRIAGRIVAECGEIVAGLLPFGKPGDENVAIGGHVQGRRLVIPVDRTVVAGYPGQVAGRVVLDGGVVVIGSGAGMPGHIHAALVIHGEVGRVILVLAGSLGGFPVEPSDPQFVAIRIVLYRGVVIIVVRGFACDEYVPRSVRSHGHGLVLAACRAVIKDGPQLVSVSVVLDGEKITVGFADDGKTSGDHVALRVHGQRVGQVALVGRTVVGRNPSFLKGSAIFTKLRVRNGLYLFIPVLKKFHRFRTVLKIQKSVMPRCSFNKV